MRKYQINLLQKKEPSFVNKVVYFSLHYLRYIVVLTQIIVIIVFFYRFKVDQEILDLKDSTNQKEEIIKVTLPLIEEAQAIDNKLNQIKQVLQKQGQFITNLDYIFSIFPASAVLTNFEISYSTIKLMGTTNDPVVIKLFFEKLKRERKFKHVVISQISKSGFGFEFSIFISI